MIKKLVLYGLAMIILAVIIFFVSGYLFSKGVSSSMYINNFTLSAGGFSAYPINAGNATQIGIYVIAEKPINVYILNGSAYSMLSGYLSANKNASGLAYIGQLKIGNGSVFKNVTFRVIPLMVNKSGNISKSSMYAFFDNTPGSASSNSTVNTTFSYLPLQSSNLVAYELLDVLAFVLFVIGIVILIWGLVKKPKQEDSVPAKTKDQKDKDYVDKLYKGVKGTKKGKTESDS